MITDYNILHSNIENTGMSRMSRSCIKLATRIGALPDGGSSVLTAAVDSVSSTWDQVNEQMGVAEMRKSIARIKAAPLPRSIENWRGWDVVCALSAHIAQMNGMKFCEGAIMEEAGAPLLAEIVGI